MKLRKTQLAAAVGAALLAGGTAVQAQNLQVQLYGQVNRAMMFADDENQSRWFHVDGQPSSTRFGIQGTAQAAPGLRIGARIESEMKSNPSNVVNFGSTQPGTPSAGAVTTSAGTTVVLFAERWLDLTFEGAWGKVNMGQGSGAADDASTIDLSGTAVVNGWCICDWGGGISFVTAAGAPITTIGASTDNMDFESRYDRIMYTTPVFGGFRAQAGFGQRTSAGEAVEASLWYSGKLAGEIQAAIGWSSVNLGTGTGPTATDDRETIGGSVSWLHTSGFNVSLAYTDRDLDGVAGGRNAKHQSAKLGYKTGPHAVSVTYTMVKDLSLAGDEVTAYSVGYVWNPIRWAEIYAAYIMYSLDHTRAGVGSANDITVAVVGSRVRF